MTESSIYRSSLSKVVAYRVKAYMSQHLFAYEFVIKIAEYLHPCPEPKIVYETSFLLKEDLNVKAFKKTLVALSELLFPESKEKEREFKRALFRSVIPGCKRPDDILTAESGPFPFPVDKSLPTGEEIASKLEPIYVALQNEVEEEKINSPDSQLKESELSQREKDKRYRVRYVLESLNQKLNEIMEEKTWEGKRKDKVEGLLEFINYLLQKAEGEKDEFSDSTEYKDYVDSLSKIKEKLENEKDSLIEKEFYLLFSAVHQIYDKRITNLLNRNVQE